MRRASKAVRTALMRFVALAVLEERATMCRSWRHRPSRNICAAGCHADGQRIGPVAFDTQGDASLGE